jgi:hypothetical protein
MRIRLNLLRGPEVASRTYLKFGRMIRAATSSTTQLAAATPSHRSFFFPGRKLQTYGKLAQKGWSIQHTTRKRPPERVWLGTVRSGEGFPKHRLI